MAWHRNNALQWKSYRQIESNRSDGATRDSNIGQICVMIAWHRSNRHLSNLPLVGVHKFHFSVSQLIISSYPRHFEKLLEKILSIRRRETNLTSTMFTVHRNSFAGVWNITFRTICLTWTVVPRFLLHDTLTYTMIRIVRIQVRRT